jgi:NEDD8-activating enzyme E1
MTTDIDLRWSSSWQRLLARPSPFGNETGMLPNGIFEPSQELFDKIRFESKVLVIGAGGLGCEILKDLALSGITDIHVIGKVIFHGLHNRIDRVFINILDMDTIDITNLNRQFLFRVKDIGRSKAEVAAEFVMQRVPGCRVTPYICAIQDKDPEFYKQFRVVIGGLDNIEARRWLNCILTSLIEFDEEGNIDPNTIVPLIDGGTEAFAGHARVIIPHCTSCFECNIDLFPPAKTFQLCTIASTPRKPEHCIAYAYMLAWEREFPTRKLNADSPDDMQWVFQCAAARAQEYGIDGVTYFLTLGVVKTIIPAVASTNAVMAANCVNESIKLLSFCAQTVNTYYMYMGGQGLNTSTFSLEKKDDCPVCGINTQPRKMRMSKDHLLSDLIGKLSTDPHLQILKPSLTGQSTTLFMQKPESLRKLTEPNLYKSLGDLLIDGEIVNVCDPCLPSLSLSIQIEFYDLC